MLSRSPKTPALPMKVVPLTSLKGFEIGPSFSRDGTRVAFAWDGEAQDNYDIYVQLVGSAEPPQRLTTRSGVRSESRLVTRRYADRVSAGRPSA